MLPRKSLHPFNRKQNQDFFPGPQLLPNISPKEGEERDERVLTANDFPSAGIPFPTPCDCAGAGSWGSWPGRNLRERKHLVWWLLVTSRFSFSFWSNIKVCFGSLSHRCVCVCASVFSSSILITLIGIIEMQRDKQTGCSLYEYNLKA